MSNQTSNLFHFRNPTKSNIIWSPSIRFLIRHTPRTSLWNTQTTLLIHSGFISPKPISAKPLCTSPQHQLSTIQTKQVSSSPILLSCGIHCISSLHTSIAEMYEKPFRAQTSPSKAYNKKVQIHTFMHLFSDASTIIPASRKWRKAPLTPLRSCLLGKVEHPEIGILNRMERFSRGPRASFPTSRSTHYNMTKKKIPLGTSHCTSSFTTG